MHTQPYTAILADPDPWLTVQQSAAAVQAHEATVRRAIWRHQLRHARIGGRKSIRIRRSWLDQWLERTSTPIEVSR